MLNNSGFEDAIDDIYPLELELKKTMDCPTALSYMYLYRYTYCNCKREILYDIFW